MSNLSNLETGISAPAFDMKKLKAEANFTFASLRYPNWDCAKEKPPTPPKYEDLVQEILYDNILWKEIEDEIRKISNKFPDDFSTGDFALLEKGKEIDGEFCYLEIGLLKSRLFFIIRFLNLHETKEKLAFFQKLFDNADGNCHITGRKTISPAIILEKFEVPTQSEFAFEKDESFSIVDLPYPVDIDDRIVELIRYINDLGITTTFSCAGHREGEVPNIAIDASEVFKAAKLFDAWHRAGGLNYKCDANLPLYAFSKGITNKIDQLTFRPVSEGNSLQEFHKDLDNLTEFIIEKTGGRPESILTPIELAQKQRRRVEKIL